MYTAERLSIIYISLFTKGHLGSIFNIRLLYMKLCAFIILQYTSSIQYTGKPPRAKFNIECTVNTFVNNPKHIIYVYIYIICIVCI